MVKDGIVAIQVALGNVCEFNTAIWRAVACRILRVLICRMIQVGTPGPIPPTSSPIQHPTSSPSYPPSSSPSFLPTSVPSSSPSFTPTFAPIFAPSNMPTNTPSVAPSSAPTVAPTPSYVCKIHVTLKSIQTNHIQKTHIPNSRSNQRDCRDRNIWHPN